MLKRLLLTVGLVVTAGTWLLAELAAEIQVRPGYKEYIHALTYDQPPPVKVRKTGIISTKATFKPPVDILIAAKTDSTDLRLSYAAEQLIFNWSDDPGQLRVDGGPAGGSHTFAAGLIPAGQYVTIRWHVTDRKQAVYVDDQLRFEHRGDYSKLNNPITVFTHGDAEVTVKSIQVRDLPADAE